jgi:hypothetical protein
LIAFKIKLKRGLRGLNKWEFAKSLQEMKMVV